MTAAVNTEYDLEQTRDRLIAEWMSANPRTEADIRLFYRYSQHLGAELNAWHEEPERQEWTKILVHVAGNIKAKLAVDIGCGAGHDLRALRNQNIVETVVGVEPNSLLRHALEIDGIPCHQSIDDARGVIEAADLLICCDVLEHITDPEAWLAGWAGTAKLGAVLVETTATHDTGTPLHLEANRGWHPGHCLETLGWELLDSRDRIRVWQRMKLAVEPRASVHLCAYRACSLPTMASIMQLQKDDWRVVTKWSDGLISRARSILASRWWAETADDVFLMVDDDIVFEPESAARLVNMCRSGYDIICAAYPVRDGGHLALRDMGDITFAPNAEPVQVRHAATGFLAVHRKVLDALIPTLPLCHGNQPWAFWAMFQPYVIADEPSGGHNYLSEDWAFCERALDLGFTCWLDPSIKLGHIAQIELNVVNMQGISDALKEGKRV